MTTFHSHAPVQTVAFGKSLAAKLKGGDIVALTGDLGSGKTHFVAGVCDGLGVKVHATSPTFTLVNEYAGDIYTVVHIDLYRIANEAELFGLGVDDYFVENNVCLIEWAERMSDHIPLPYLQVWFSHGESETERVIRVGEVRQRVRNPQGAVA